MIWFNISTYLTIFYYLFFCRHGLVSCLVLMFIPCLPPSFFSFSHLLKCIMAIATFLFLFLFFSFLLFFIFWGCGVLQFSTSLLVTILIMYIFWLGRLLSNRDWSQWIVTPSDSGCNVKVQILKPSILWRFYLTITTDPRSNLIELFLKFPFTEFLLYIVPFFNDMRPMVKRNFYNACIGKMELLFISSDLFHHV